MYRFGVELRGGGNRLRASSLSRWNALIPVGSWLALGEGIVGGMGEPWLLFPSLEEIHVRGYQRLSFYVQVLRGLIRGCWFDKHESEFGERGFDMRHCLHCA